MTAAPRLLITCEHGGNRIPAKYRHYFRKHGALLQSHRGYDPGALALARDFAAAFDAELVYSTVSRLLVELNRSPHHPKLFSEITRPFPPGERQQLLQRYYFPYREWVENQIREATEQGAHVLHISCHTFTPSLDGIERCADVGLLYDPRRKPELDFCMAWQRELRSSNPQLAVRRNYPYRGYDDGLTTHLRRRYSDAVYSGIELEVNQSYPLGDAQIWREMRKRLIASFERVVRQTA